MLLCDDNGVEWECAELAQWPVGDGAGSRDYRLLRCTRVNCPEAPRYISVPLEVDLADASVLRDILSRPRKRE